MFSAWHKSCMSVLKRFSWGLSHAENQLHIFSHWCLGVLHLIHHVKRRSPEATPTQNYNNIPCLTGAMGARCPSSFPVGQAALRQQSFNQMQLPIETAFKDQWTNIIAAHHFITWCNCSLLQITPDMSNFHMKLLQLKAKLARQQRQVTCARSIPMQLPMFSCRPHDLTNLQDEDHGWGMSFHLGCLKQLNSACNSLAKFQISWR